jgi:hypothetical protein
VVVVVEKKNEVKTQHCHQHVGIYLLENAEVDWTNNYNQRASWGKLLRFLQQELCKIWHSDMTNSTG